MCLQNTQEVNLAAAYSETPTPCHSSRGSYTSSAAGSGWASRGNKENQGGSRRQSRSSLDGKNRQIQSHTLLGAVPSISCTQRPTTCINQCISQHLHMQWHHGPFCDNHFTLPVSINASAAICTCNGITAHFMTTTSLYRRTVKASRAPTIMGIASTHALTHAY